ncbi:MGH1-like glycoside hydrolase domain-containing protein [Pseudopedobacter saltans]|uniref:MGH1-like glycoside hydrolase domain-containing protein n=1 Tax=Pseudopedobacter saltans TaxID=151895 RepID=UPI0001EBC7E2|nr:glycosyl hydrolase family 65 protein [Pseudopedobacter saltans]
MGLSKYILACTLCVSQLSVFAQSDLLDKKLRNYVKEFNANDNEAVINKISNAQSADWMAANVPLLDCPDKEIEEKYYFRWWSYRKHIKDTPEGTIVTEFIEPVKHAAKYNAISCALGHHLYEGRWIKNNDFLKEYVNFWLYKADVGEKKPRFHQFSSWLDDALLAYYKVNPDKEYIKSIIADLDKDFQKWEQDRKLANGLFWQHDVKDGMEESVSGSRVDKNMRPTINAYMYANAVALSTFADILGDQALKAKYQAKAEEIRKLTINELWDKDEKFFKTKVEKTNQLHEAREAIGFVPWYFNLPLDQKEYAQAWDQLLDTAGFKAKWGLTTAERREPTFRTRGSGHGCEWDGAIWPFATTQTLRGLANLLTNYKHHAKVDKNVFYNELHKYAWSQQMYGKPYIGEYQDESNGEWLKGDHPRSKFYNHSAFMDHVIQDLIGFKPRLDAAFDINPLIPNGKWDYFCLDNLTYQGKQVKILWDKTGKHYQQGKGFKVFVDGKLVAKKSSIKPLSVKL